MLLAIGVLGILSALLLAMVLSMFFRQRRTEDMLMRIFDELPANCCICNANGKVLLALGKSQFQDFPKIRNINDLPEAAAQATRQCIHETLNSSTKIIHEYPDTGHRIVLHKLNGLPGAKNLVCIINLDISKQLTLQDELQKQREWCKDIFRSLPVPYIITDGTGRIFLQNHAAGLLTGYSEKLAENMLLSNVLPVTISDTGASAAELFDQCLIAGKEIAKSDGLTLHTRNQHQMKIVMQAYPIRKNRLTLTGMIITFQDITTEIVSRQAGIKQQQSLENAIDIANIGYFRYDPAEREYTAGGNMTDLWPAVNGKLLPEEQFICQNDLPEFMRQRNRLLRGDSSFMDVRFGARHHSQIRYYRLKAVKDRIDDKKLFGIIQDISVYNENEQKNAELQTFINVLLRIMPLILTVKEASKEYRYEMVGDTFAKFIGQSPETLHGHTDYEIIPDRKIVDLTREFDTKTNAANMPLEFTEHLKDRNGNEHQFQIYKIPYNTPGGRRMILTIGSDITALKTAEKHESEQRLLFETVLNLLPVGLMIKDVNNDLRYLYWNKWIAEQSGVPANRLIGKTDLEDCPFPNNAAGIRQRDIQAVEAKTLLIYENTLQSRRGNEYIYKCYKQYMQFGDNQYLLTLTLDMTAERQIAAERERLIENQKNLLADERIINNCLRRIPLEKDYPNMVMYILETIGSNADADRCGVYRLNEQTKMIEIQHVWHNPELIDYCDYMSELPYDIFDIWLNNVSKKRYNVCENSLNTDSLPPAARQLLAKQQIKSNIWCGIFEENKLVGILCIGYIRRPHHFTENNIKSLQNTVNLLKLANHRKQQFDAIEAANALQRCIIDTITTPILMLSPDYKVEHVSPSMCELHDIEAADIIGKSCAGKLCNLGKPNEQCPAFVTLQTGKPQHMEITVAGREYEVNTMPHYFNGKIQHILECFIDVTEAKRTQEMLRGAALAAQETARAKSMFLATMSHELRTPLNAIIGFADMLETDEADRQQLQESIHSINLAANTLLELINDILDLSKLEAGQMRIVPDKLDLSSFFNDLSAIFTAKLHENNLTFTLKLPENLPLLYLDALRLRQILLNIIGNAIKFTRTGGIMIQVEFAADDTGAGNLTIAVKDTGVGISEAFIEHIFEPFTQDLATNKTQRGTGLGLSICKRLVEQMHGKITVQSIVGQGSCFTVTLPGIKFEFGKITATNQPKTQIAKISGSFLVVDDVQMNLKVMTALLTKLGGMVRTADNASEALKQLDGFVPDIIFTDLWMPEMNGNDFASAVRKQAAMKDVRIVAVTGESELDDKTKTCFDNVLTKPVTLNKLSRVITEYCGEKS